MGRVMKDSGVDWIGEIPVDWPVIKTKNAVKLNSNRSRGGTNYVGMENIESGTARRVLGSDARTSEDGNDGSYNKGQILFGKLRPYLRKVWLAEDDGSCSTEFLALAPTSQYVGKYLLYVMLSEQFCSFVNDSCKGVKMPRADWSIVGGAFICRPPVEEQHKVASYLDHHTSIIDQEVTLLQKKIGLLQEQRKAIIFEAVTKGLDPTVPMKDSGVEWIGEIPEGWKIYPLKRVFDNRNKKNVRPNGQAVTENILSVMKDVGVINYNDKGNVGNKKSEDVTGYKLVHPGDIVINKMNVIIGSCGISKEFGALSVVYIVLIPKKHILDPKFADYMVFNKKWQEYQRSIATGIMEIRESVDTCRFNSQLLPVPPIEEQKSIVAYLNTETFLIDQELTLLQKKIGLLQEQRKAIIFEAVTGKIDLSNYEPKEALENN